jgi:cytoskeletal protein CcmA (bactofilin family)
MIYKKNMFMLLLFGSGYYFYMNKLTNFLIIIVLFALYIWIFHTNKEHNTSADVNKLSREALLNLSGMYKDGALVANKIVTVDGAGPIVLAGDVTIEGNLNSKKNVTIEGNLNSKKNVTIDQNLHTKGNGTFDKSGNDFRVGGKQILREFDHFHLRTHADKYIRNIGNHSDYGNDVNKKLEANSNHHNSESRYYVSLRYQA